MPKFLRRNSDSHSKLGKRRKKKQIWRYPTGRHNKMREKRRGYPPVVNIGYQKSKKERGKIKERNPIMINTLKDLEKLTKKDIAIIASIGKKKKLEIIKKAEEKGVIFYNINPKNYINKNNKKVNIENSENKK